VLARTSFMRPHHVDLLWGVTQAEGTFDMVKGNAYSMIETLAHNMEGVGGWVGHFMRGPLYRPMAGSITAQHGGMCGWVYDPDPGAQHGKGGCSLSGAGAQHGRGG
jgi:hypothetical protein